MICLRLKRQQFLNAAKAIGFTKGNLFITIEGDHVKLFTATSKVYEIPIEQRLEGMELLNILEGNTDGKDKTGD